MSRTFSIEYGSVFSRILAKENIIVEIDSSAETAYISLVDRILTLPEWEGSSDLQRFLMCHETSHALHTPPKEWIDAIEEKELEHRKIYKDILNIFEDARIDRLIQQKYVIMSKWYYLGTKEFVIDRDIWGLENNPTKKYSLINRINIFFKTKPLNNRYNIQFDTNETVWIDRTEKATLFKQIKKIADDFFYQLPEDDQKSIEIEIPFGRFEVVRDKSQYKKDFKAILPSFKNSGTKHLKRVDYKQAIIRSL